MSKNHDATNFVQLYRGAGGTAFSKQLPGDVELFRVDGNATDLYAKADTGSCEVEFLVLEL